VGGHYPFYLNHNLKKRRRTMEYTKTFLEEKEMPTQWYNIQADLPSPLPPVLHPGTGKPIGPQDLAPLFPMELIKQEVSQERYIEIPEEVQRIYQLWRPSPIYRARRLEKMLDTPAKIYYKWEGVSPAGSHKPNTAVAQAFYNKKEGVKAISTETGAGQWGSALAMGCMFFGLECKVYMVKVSYHQKPYRKVMMETWGAKVTPSPSTETKAGGICWPRTRTRRAAWDWPSARRWRWQPPGMTRNTHWAAS
jgi:tryptophan synthase beta chain